MADNTMGDAEMETGGEVEPLSAAAASLAARPAHTHTSDSSFLPWVEKYRPNSLDDLISQGDIINTINRLIDASRLPHMLFYGPPGTGKTSTILAIAKRLYGPQWKSMTLELNASDDRGIDVVRDQIKSFAGTRKLFSTGVKLVILDEADAMTAEAQFALRRVIEKYARNTRFCMICNYVSKIIPALQSRCTRFRFAPLTREAIEGRLRYIIDKEALTTRITDGAIKAIIILGNGDMRRILNVLQSAASGYDTLDEDSIYAVTGNPRPEDIRVLLAKLLKESFESGYIRESGAAITCREIVKLIMPVVHDDSYMQEMSTSGFAASDVLSRLARVSRQTKLPPIAKSVLLERLCDIEYRLAFGTSDKLQTAAVVGAYHHVRDVVQKQRDKELAGGAK